jgi:hypothetical protein
LLPGLGGHAVLIQRLRSTADVLQVGTAGKDSYQELDELGLRFVVPLPLVNRDAFQRLSETKVLGKESSGH